MYRLMPPLPLGSRALPDRAGLLASLSGLAGFRVRRAPRAAGSWCRAVGAGPRPGVRDRKKRPPSAERREEEAASQLLL